MKIKIFIFLILLTASSISASDYIIFLDNKDPYIRENLLSLYGEYLEPFYPVEIKGMENIFILSDKHYDKLSGYLSRKAITAEKSRHYKFQNPQIPNDPYFNQQYALNLLRFIDAWQHNTGSNNIVVGIVDSGIDYNHEDLYDRIWINQGEIPDSGFDDDNNGFIDDYIGWNFVSAGPDEVYPGETPGPSNDPMDFSGHGTAISGLIGAMTNNNTGIAGASHKSRLMAVKSGYVNNEGIGVLKDIDAARGIVYAAQNGAHIINLSWGDINPSNIIQKAINYALRENVILIAAAGNSGGNFLFFPASLDSVISVGSVAPNGIKSTFSNYSNDLDIFIYGENLLTTAINNNYINTTGTSMSCAYATGAMVLLKSHFPYHSNDELRARLISTADNTGFHANSRFAGILNMNSCLTNFPVSNIVLSDYQFFNSADPSQDIKPGDTVSLYIKLKNLWQRSAYMHGYLKTKEPAIYLYNREIRVPPINTFDNFVNTDSPFTVFFTENFFYGKRTKLRFTLEQYSSLFSRCFDLSFVMPYPQNPGFPFSSGKAIAGSPLVVDSNNSNKNEIFWGNYSGKFYGMDYEGNVLEGFPILSKAPFVSSPAYADIQEDGNYYIIFGGLDSNLYVIDRFGNNKPGFPIRLNGPIYGSTPVGKLDGETHSIIAATLTGSLYAICPEGNIIEGFPVNIPFASYSSPALADIDNDNTLSIIIGGADNGLYVFDRHGNHRENFPFFTNSYVFSSPAVGDIDNNGFKDIVFASYDRRLYAIDGNGILKPGFPVNLGAPIFSSPCLHDINLDGHLNIIIGSGNPANRLFALDHTGQVLNGFPIVSEHAFSSSPSVYDINNDGHPDIAIGSYSGEIYIISHNGGLFKGFPYPVGAEILSSPTFYDVDNSGDIDLIFGDHNGMLHILDLQFESPGPVSQYWFTFRANYHRTGSTD